MKDVGQKGWETFVIDRIPEILKEKSFTYGKYSVSYHTNVNEFLKTYLVSRGKKSFDKVLKVNARIRNNNPSSKELGEVVFEDVPVAKIPILTDSGIVVKGTKYFYINEIKQSDGWYILSSAEKEEDQLESIGSLTVTEGDGELEIPTFDSEFGDDDEEFTEDELDLEGKDSINDLLNSYKDNSNKSIDSEESLDSEEKFDSTELFSERIENNKEDSNKYTTYLEYRGPFARNIIFSIKKNKDGTKSFKVRFISNKRGRTVSWFTFLKAIMPNLSAEEIARKFDGLPIINEAYASALHTHALKSKDVKDKEPSIEASSEECAMYCLQEFFITKKGNKFLNGVENPVGEFINRINLLRCNTEHRNKDIFSFCNFKDYVLREDLIKSGLSKDELNIISSQIKIPTVGSKLTMEQLVILDSFDSLKSLYLSKDSDSRVFKVVKPEKRENFSDEIVDMFRQYLLVCEGIGSSSKMDNFRNKEIETLELKIEKMIEKTLFEFNQSFSDVISTRGSVNSEISENEFSKCFEKDITKGYKDLLKSIHESSNYQGKDDTNSLAEYSQGKQLKYGVKEAPLSLRSLAEDQFGFVCPQTTSEGGNVGLNIYRTLDTVIENGIIKKKFYSIHNGEIVKENGANKIVKLSAGEVGRNFVLKYSENLSNTDINSEVDCYCGNQRTKVRLRNIKYMELADAQNVSANLGIIVGSWNNGGKRGTMGPNQEKQSQPLLIPKRSMVDTGVFEHENIGVIRADKFIKKALVELGEIDYINLINDDWKIELISSKQKNYASQIEFRVIPPVEVCLDNENMNSIIKKVFYYDIATLSPTVKRSLRHFVVVVKDNPVYSCNEIVARASDVDVEKHDSDGKGYLGVESSNFGPAGGTQLRVAFGIYEGFGYEDALVINEDSVLSGKLATLTFFNVTDEIKITGNPEEDSKFGKLNDEQASYLTSKGIPEVGASLGVGDIVISRLNPIVSSTMIDFIPSYTRLKEGSKDRGCVVASNIEEYTKEDGFKYLRATVSLMYISNPSLGTKFSGGHGNKGVVSRIVPSCLMPYDEEGVRADIILNSTGSLPRNNLGQFTEIIKNTVGIKSDRVQLVKPFEKWDIPGELATARLNDVVPKKMYDGKTGQPFDRDILIGYMTIFRSEHDVKGKFNSCSLNGNVNSNTLTVARGPGGGQRVGEMTTWALLAKGANKYLDSMFTVQGADVLKKEEYIKALKNNESPEDIDNSGDNRLNILAKVRYLMMGCSFEDYNKGSFRALNDELIGMSDSPFIISKDYEIEEPKQYGELSTNSGAKAISGFQSFKYGRCVDMHKRIIYPIYIESSFLLHNMWYLTTSNKETNCFYSAVSSLISNKWEKPLYCSREDVKKLSDVTIKALLNRSKVVIWIKGMRLPILTDYEIYTSNLKYIVEIDGYSKSKFEECVKVHKGYPAIMSILLGFDFDVNDSADNIKCKKNGSLFESLVLYYLVRAVDGENEDKFGVSSYNFGDFYRDTLSFAEMMGFDVSQIYKLSNLFEKIKSKVQEINLKIEKEMEKPAEERSFPEGMGSVLDQFICNEKEYARFPELKELGDLNELCSIQRYDLYIEISSRYFWVPPRVFRGDNVGGTPSDLKKMITGLVALFSDYSDSHAKYFYTTEVYKRLSSITKYCITELKNHNNKNAILRDQVMSVRVNCSSRGYITVDPTLGMNEIGLPIHHAAGMLDTFLHQQIGYPESSCLYAILSSLREEGGENSEIAIRNKRTKSEIFKFLASDNRASFNSVLRFNSAYIHNIENYISKGNSEVESRNLVFEECKASLIKRLEELLEEHPVTLERAPNFWENSIQSFKGLLRFNCHNISVCPLVCKAFNADFDGDQMSGTIAIDSKAIEEQREIMFPSSNLINVSDGKLIQNLNQDMALGIYWMTIERENKFSKSVMELSEDERREYSLEPNKFNFVVRELESPVNSYGNLEVLRQDIDMGTISPHDYIVFSHKLGRTIKFYKDTAGRILFNGLIPETSSDKISSGFTEFRRVVSNGNVVLVKDTVNLPEDMEFLDSYCVLYTDTVNLKCVRNKDLQKIANNMAHMCDSITAKDYLESTMRVAFDMAHKSGVSLSLYDFEEIITDKDLKEKVNNLKEEVDNAKRLLELGFATQEEYASYLVSRFNQSNTDFSGYLRDNLSRYSNLYLLIDSGARGSFEQLVTQSVMVGLPTDAKGNVIPEPIFGNYAEGLNSNEYFNTSYSSREALVTGSMYTGNIGEILRTMVYQCEHNMIRYDYEGRDFCDADSVPIPLDYDVTYSNEFDIDLVELVPDNSFGEWDKTIEEWTLINNKTSNFSSNDVFKRLLVNNQVKEVKYKIKGSEEVKVSKVIYKITDYCKNMIIERSLDMNKWSRTDKCFDTKEYFVVDSSTIEFLEEEATPSVNIFMAFNCKHREGICRRCFGVTDIWKVPEEFSNVGIKSAQSIGQVSSQLALDSHKNSGGSPLSNFSSFVEILRQQNLGSQVFIAKQSGIVNYTFDSNKSKVNIRIISSDSIQDIGTYKLKTDISFLKYSNGDYVRAGDVLYYNKTINYDIMNSLMEYVDLGDLTTNNKCKLNLLREIVELYDCDLSIRHFDILLRDLTKFGICRQTELVDGKLFVEGGVYDSADLIDSGLNYSPVLVSSLKSMQLNNKHVSSMAMSYLRRQIGNASILKKESIRSPLNTILEGICLEDVYGENPLTDAELEDKYYLRRYGENIFNNVQKVKSSFNAKKTGSLNKRSLNLSNKSERVQKKNNFINFDKSIMDKLKEQVYTQEDESIEVQADAERDDKYLKDKRTIRDRIVLHNRPDKEKKDKNELQETESSDLSLNAEKTSFFE